MFNKLLPYIDEKIEAIPIEYSGRGKRSNEKLIDDYNIFLMDVASQINEKITTKWFAILGYSIGSAVTYDLISKKLLKFQPIHSFMCARGSLKKSSESQSYSGLSDQDFLDKMIGLGGMDKRILEDKRFLDIYMRPVRADYKLWEQFKYAEDTPLMPCNITAIYRSKDPLAGGVTVWEEMTEGNVDYFEMGENHFFINQCYKEMSNIINEHLKRYYSMRDGSVL